MLFRRVDARASRGSSRSPAWDRPQSDRACSRTPSRAARTSRRQPFGRRPTQRGSTPFDSTSLDPDRRRLERDFSRLGDDLGRDPRSRSDSNHDARAPQIDRRCLPRTFLRFALGAGLAVRANLFADEPGLVARDEPEPQAKQVVANDEANYVPEHGTGPYLFVGLEEDADQPKRPLAFRVVERASKKPIQGATVLVHAEKGGRLTTDVDGRCVAQINTTLKDDMQFRVSIWKSGYAARSVEFSGRDIRDAKFTSYTMELSKTKPVGGVVVDEEGKPIAGARLIIKAMAIAVEKGRENQLYWGWDPVVTDEHGRWTYDLTPIGLEDERNYLVISVAHPDFASYFQESNLPRFSTKALRDRSATIVLKKGRTIAGRVIDSTSKPVANATVRLTTINPSWNPEEAKTDAEGRFRVANAREEVPAIQVFAKEYAPTRLTLDDTVDRKSLTIRVSPGRKVEGRAIDTSGKPIAGLGVFAIGPWGFTLAPKTWNPTTDRDGRFVWEHAPNEAFQLVVMIGGATEEGRFSVAPGQSTVEYKIKHFTHVFGTVADAETGKPIERFRATPVVDDGLKSPDDGPRRVSIRENAVEGKDGRFEMKFGLVEGPKRFVRIEAQGYRATDSSQFSKDDEKTVLAIKLQPAEAVSGTVRDADGKPIAGATVLLALPQNPLTVENGRLRDDRYVRLQGEKIETRADGRFSFIRPAGPFKLLVLCDQGIALLPSEELDKPRDVTIKPWGRIEGQVFVGRKPDAGAKVGAVAELLENTPPAPLVSLQL